MPITSESQGSSTRPYLLRALHDWCSDNGFTPYLAVAVGPGVQVPLEYVKNNEIVLNIGLDATSGLLLGNEFIEFRARFGGVPRDIRVPVDHVVAIYARENGQGMAFPMPTEGQRSEAATESAVPVRGLRLARNEPEPAASASEADPPDPKSSEPGAPPEPPDPAAPSGARPSLKRIK